MLLLLLTTITPAPWISITLGVFIGLTIRNRGQELVLLASSLIYFYFINLSLLWVTVILLSVVLLNIDRIFIELFKKDTPTRLTVLYSSIFLRAYKKDSQLSEKSSMVNHFFANLKNMFNIYSENSLWPNMGVFMLISVVSFFYIFQHQLYPNYFMFVLIYSAMYGFLGLIISQRAFIKKREVWLSYFGGRQMYVLFIAAILFNGLVIIHSFFIWDVFYCVIYSILVFFYILHQIYRILEFHFSDRIFESRVINYPKNSAEWRIHLGNFIRSLTNPSVILGTNFSSW